MTHTSTEQERAEFEARFKHLDLTQEPDSWGVPRYKHDAISLAWEAWQAARHAQVVPQGWKSVQIGLLERIQESLGSFISDQGWSQSDMDTADALGGLLAASQPAAQGMNAPNEWEDIRTLPTCDDLIWLYCQDSNTIDGPIAPEPNLEEYGWSHWAYANAPSTAWIDAAQAKQGEAQQ